MKFWLGLACGVLLGGVVGMLTMARAVSEDHLTILPTCSIDGKEFPCYTDSHSTIMQMDIQGAVYAGRDKDGVPHVILTDEQGRVIVSPREGEVSDYEHGQPRPTHRRDLIPLVPYGSPDIPHESPNNTGPDVRVWRQRCQGELVWGLEQP